LFGSDFGDFATEKSGDGFFGRAFEERVDEMAKSGTPSDVSRDGGDVDVAGTVFLVANLAFSLEHAKLCADSGIVRVAGHSRQDFGHGGAFEFVENVHDLAFAAGKDLGE
jgi:hypothetical protein